MREKYFNFKQYQYLTHKLIMFIIIATLFAGCKKDDSNVEVKHDYLIEARLLATVKKAEVLNIAGNYQDVYDLVSTKDLSDVSVYKITYKTINVEGAEIIASGALIIPSTSNILPILSYQHGTLFSDSEAPSNFFNGLETRALAVILASTGFAVSLPDYLGYGESADYTHPYEHAKTLASASYDMLMAAKEFMKDNNTSFSEKLFLTGYSEGGFATMALQKYIEENSDLTITMSAPASGAYNKTAFAKEVVQRNEDLNFLPQFMWVIYSYNWIYGLNRGWSYYVNEPYATTLEAVTNPFKLRESNISHNPQILFTNSTRDGIVNETDTEFMSALSDNDIFNWTPQFPIRLYYGTADDYVFPVNSETAYEAMLANGADVTKVVFPGADHSTAFMPYVLDMFELFESLK